MQNIQITFNVALQLVSRLSEMLETCLTSFNKMKK
jgi:hypothetical protein